MASLKELEYNLIVRQQQEAEDAVYAAIIAQLELRYPNVYVPFQPGFQTAIDEVKHQWGTVQALRKIKEG